MPETDEQLMLRVARQDEEDALRELMSRHRDLLVNHFAKRGVHHEYEDLAQETFFRIYKARRRYRPTAAFRTWMFTIAQRVWIDYVRKSARRTRRETAYRDEPRPKTASGPGMHRHDLWWALEQLSPGHRDVVVHSQVDGLTNREVAEILDIPEGTVKSRLHHALDTLKTILTREEHRHEPT